MTDVLGQDIKEDNVHSFLICKKCFKVFDELDELEWRVAQLKMEVLNNYKKSVLKSKNGELTDEGAEKGQQKEKNDADKENQMSKKILDIPSSDDDNTQVLIQFLVIMSFCGSRVYCG